MNISSVARSIDENLDWSILLRSLELVGPPTTIHRILHQDLDLWAFTHEFKSVVSSLVGSFKWLRIILIESRFHLEGFVNKQTGC